MRNFDFCITNETKHLIYLNFGQVAILLFSSIQTSLILAIKDSQNPYLAIKLHIGFNAKYLFTKYGFWDLKKSGSDSSLFLNTSDSIKLNPLIDFSQGANLLRKDYVMALDFHKTIVYWYWSKDKIRIIFTWFNLINYVFLQFN